MHRDAEQPRAIVVGATDVGSAVAVALHRIGMGVVLCDDVDPAWMRRGMAYTNTWYVGGAELDGLGAVFCGSVRSIPTVLARGDLLAATTWSWAGVAAALAPVAVVHVRSHAREPSDLRASTARGWSAIGVGPGFVAGENVDVAVEAAPGPSAGSVIECGATLPRVEYVDALGGAGGERFVRAPAGGRFATSKRIGAIVSAGEIVGAIGAMPVHSPIAGALRGLSARGAFVRPGARVVEVDPRGIPALCFGIGERPRAIAEGVVAALARVAGHDPAALRALTY